jgi:hypothetical protein
MPIDNHRQSHHDEPDRDRDIIPSPVDPNYECIPIESQVADGAVASHPPGGNRSSGRPICPDGYVPRRKTNRPRYKLNGKVIIDPDTVPERNPKSTIKP